MMGQFEALTSLTDEEWLDVMLKTIDEPSFRGVALPPVPPEGIQKRFNGTVGPSNIHAGFAFYQVVKRTAASFGHPLHPEMSVLDFGCGWGRVLRFLLKDVSPDHLKGVDIDPIGIASCRETMPYIDFDQSNVEPPLGFESDTFDLIYAYSVFSHLPEALHLDWLAELSRVLKPGGLLLATTQRRGFLTACRELKERGTFHAAWEKQVAEGFDDVDAALTEYDAGNFVFAAKPSPTYGHAVIPRSYAEKEWAPYVSVRAFIDQPTLLPQALIVGEKL